DGQSVYQYVRSSPAVYIDHMGLNVDDIDPRMAYLLAYLENARERGSVDSETADRLRGRIDSRIGYMQAYRSGIYHHDGLNGATAAAMYVYGMRGEDSVVHIDNVTNEQLIRGNSDIGGSAIAKYGLDPGQSVLISADDPLKFGIGPGGTYNPYVYGNIHGLFSGRAYCNEEGEIVLDGEVTILPDTYNFDPKPWGKKRSYPGEALTRVGMLLPGNHAYDIYVQGAVPYSQSPAVNSTAWTSFAYFGTYYGY
ncbi:MAG: hypothetical protein L3J79_08425, partial [Candidatus Marinimicrobia bacterium]|nr:hypothetical protein [Candidatus Neomarinimicrobiota bacterium]